MTTEQDKRAAALAALPDELAELAGCCDCQSLGAEKPCEVHWGLLGQFTRPHLARIVADLSGALRAITIREALAAPAHPLGRDSYPCERCGVVYGLDASIPNSTWAAIAAKDGGGEYGVLCLWCMDRIAADRGLTFNAHLYFNGLAGHSALYEGDVDDRWPEIIAGRDRRIAELEQELEDVAQRTERGLPTAEVEGSSPSVLSTSAALAAPTPSEKLPGEARLHRAMCKYWPAKDAWECVPNCTAEALATPDARVAELRYELEGVLRLDAVLFRTAANRDHVGASLLLSRADNLERRLVALTPSEPKEGE